MIPPMSMISKFKVADLLVRFTVVVALCVLSASPSIAADYVIHISVDGLNASILQSLIVAGEAPNFKRFESEGATTLNARTDFTQTVTLPNHTTMVTGRPTLQPAGLPHVPFHNWTENSNPSKRATLHKDGYIPSTFDVAHDAGRSTAMYASKDKFVIFDQSYDETNGAPNEHGRDKIDRYLMADDGPPRYSQGLNDQFIREMAAHHYNYVFVHYRDPDSAGHATSWGSATYRQAVHGVDGYLGTVFHLVESDPQFKGTTAIVLTADHGGWALGHNDPTVVQNYTVPVFVWGAGVAHGDLYAMNRQSRTEPGQARVDYAVDRQPIRNGDTGNLALSLLGLGPIPTSFINAAQDLRVAIPGDYNLDGTVDAADEVVWKKAKGSTTDLRADGNHDGRVDQADFDLWRANFGQTDVNASITGRK
jgi:Type I phosphodiesterase / nucleotide pyrophosphatase